MMASDTSVVQKMEEAQMITWPGHCNTHFFLGNYMKSHNVEMKFFYPQKKQQQQTVVVLRKIQVNSLHTSAY